MEVNIEILRVSVTETIGIRKSVFTDEQGFKEGIDEDDKLSSTVHLILKIGKMVVSTARILDKCAYYKVTRVATVKEYRGNGYGTDIMEYIIRNFKDRNIHLNSQEHAVPFYESVGFNVQGTMFLEEGHPHYLMVYFQNKY